MTGFYPMSQHIPSVDKSRFHTVKVLITDFTLSFIIPILERSICCQTIVSYLIILSRHLGYFWLLSLLYHTCLAPCSIFHSFSMESSSISLYQNIGMVTIMRQQNKPNYTKQFYMLRLSWKIAVFKIKKQKEKNLII